MNKGFFIILIAQFFSALGDNALLFAAISLLNSLAAPTWQIPILQQSFVFAFIFLSPFVGAFSDALPKGQVMFISNSIKIFGCITMLIGLHPLIAYGFVGVGAAIYSPAKYGILTECLPSERLVWANSWMEGLTVASVIFGAIIGGLLIGNHLNMPLWITEISSQLFANQSQPKLAILFILVLYLIAALFNIFIPHLPIERALKKINIRELNLDFWNGFVLLWKDPLGQVSLAVTTLFWGAGTTLRFIILAWAATSLNLDIEHSTQLTALVAVGLAIGSIFAANYVTLNHSVRVLPLGIIMGLVVLSMIWVNTFWLAVIMLLIIGILAGTFVIPMNALLQHRGHLLMGSGHSIAVQNLNENISILLMLGGYALMLNAELSTNNIIVIFGLFIAFAMGILTRFHGHDQD